MCCGIVQQLLENCNKTTGRSLGSDQTLMNRLREVFLRSRRPVRVLRLTQHHRAAHFLFTRSHVNWQLHQWRTVLFTDESRFPLTQRDGRQYAWRRRGEQYMANVVQEGDRFGQGSVIRCGVASVLMAVRIFSSSGSYRSGVYRVDTATACVGCCIRYWP